MGEVLELKKNMFKPYSCMLVRFVEGQVHVDGIVTFQLTIDSQSCVKIAEVDFLIVFNHNNAYNAILRTISLNKIGAFVLVPYLLIKFPIS